MGRANLARFMARVRCWFGDRKNKWKLITSRFMVNSSECWACLRSEAVEELNADTKKADLV